MPHPPSIVNIESQILSLPDSFFGSEEESRLMTDYDEKLSSWQESLDTNVTDLELLSVLSKKTKIPLEILKRNNISLKLEKN